MLHCMQAQMRNMALPNDLCGRIDQYYTYLWLAHSTFDLQSSTIDHLSPALESEVQIYKHRDTVQRVPFFANVRSAVIHAVVQKLLPEVYLAGDFIQIAGERAQAMYFIARGDAGVLVSKHIHNPQLLSRVRTLHAQDYFGDISLLRVTDCPHCNEWDSAWLGGLGRDGMNRSGIAHGWAGWDGME